MGSATFDSSANDDNMSLNKDEIVVILIINIYFVVTGLFNYITDVSVIVFRSTILRK